MAPIKLVLVILAIVLAAVGAFLPNDRLTAAAVVCLGIAFLV